MKQIANPDIKIPSLITDFTPAWLTQALRHKYPDTTITDATPVDSIMGTSSKIRLRLSYAKEGQSLPETVIIKGGFDEHSALMRDMHEVEARFYRDVQARLPMKSPECYFAGIDPENGHSVVIMEDLVPRQVTWCHGQRPLGFAQVAAFLDAQARYHATFWDSADLQAGGEFDWMFGPFAPWCVEYLNRYTRPEVWAHYMSLPRGAAVPMRLHDCKRIERALSQLADLHKSQPPCIVHGDTHLGNLYLEADGTPGFLDMQVRKSVWAQDVAYHMVAALDIEDRRRWERPLLTRYLEQLRNQGVKTPSFEEAWLLYRCELVYGLFIFLINEVKFQSEAVNTACAARFAAAVIDHDSLDLLGT